MLEEIFEQIKTRMLSYLEDRDEDTILSIEEYERGVLAVNESVDKLKELIINFEQVTLGENELSAQFPDLAHAMDTIDRCRAICANIETITGLMIPVIQLLFVIKKAALANSN